MKQPANERIIVGFLLVLLSAGCSSADDQAHLSESENDNSSLRSELLGLITTATPVERQKLCDIMTQVDSLRRANELVSECAIETVGAICDMTIRAGVSATAKGGVPDAQEITPDVFNSFKGALATCVRENYNVLAPRLRTIFPSLASRLPAAIDAPAGSTSTDAERRTQAARQAAFAVCSAVGNHISGRLPQVDYENACNIRVNARSCASAVADTCDVFAGNIDVRNALPELDSVAEEMLAEIANLGIDAVCTTPGMAAGFDPKKAACATISAAFGQIKTALLHGNNYWASCTGTAQAGACIGDLLQNWWNGTRSGDSATPVARPMGEPRERQYQKACVCQHTCYIDDGMFSDTRVANSTRYWFSVLEDDGDVAARSCARREGESKVSHTNSRGYEVYGHLTNCRDTFVFRESLDESWRFSNGGGGTPVTAGIFGSCR